jgi:hypothetical protein
MIMLRVKSNLGVVTVCILAIAFAGCGKKDAGQPTQSKQQAPAQTSDQTAGQPAAAAQTQSPTGGQATAGGQTPANQTPTPEDYAKLAEQNRQALTQMNQGKVVEATPGETLKALLPADLPGMKRTDASSERTQAMGVDISKAEGQYSAGENGESNITITITDAGNMSGPMRMGMAGWAMAQYSRETDSGYEKTMTYKGYKGMEEYNKNDKNGTVRIFVADRFLVEVRGDGVTMDTLKQALDKVDLAKLSSVAKGS